MTKANSPGLAYPFPSRAHLLFSCQSLPAFWLSLTLEKKRKENKSWVQIVQLLKMQKQFSGLFLKPCHYMTSSISCEWVLQP